MKKTLILTTALAIGLCSSGISYADTQIDPSTIVYKQEPTITLYAVDHWEYVGIVKERTKEFVKNTTQIETNEVTWSEKLTSKTRSQLEAKVNSELEMVGAKVSAEVGAIKSYSNGYEVKITYSKSVKKEVEYAIYQDYIYKYKKYVKGSTDVKHEYYGKYKVGSRYREKL